MSNRLSSSLESLGTLVCSGCKLQEVPSIHSHNYDCIHCMRNESANVKFEFIERQASCEAVFKQGSYQARQWSKVETVPVFQIFITLESHGRVYKKKGAQVRQMFEERTWRFRHYLKGKRSWACIQASWMLEFLQETSRRSCANHQCLEFHRTEFKSWGAWIAYLTRGNIHSHWDSKGTRKMV